MHQEGIAAMVNPLFEKVKEKASAFDHPDSVGIGWAAVEWSIDNNMVQQGFTALQETIITFMCQHYALAEDDYLEYHNREHISKSFTSIIKKIPRIAVSLNEIGPLTVLIRTTIFPNVVPDNWIFSIALCMRCQIPLLLSLMTSENTESNESFWF